MANSIAAFPIIDLHSHLVPGVDDGTRTVGESLEALQGLFREGVRLRVGARLRELHRAFDELAAACQGREAIPAIYLGQEIWAPDAAAVRRIVHRQDVGLPGKFLLVEFGFDLQGTHNGVVQAVLDSGRQIVIAHPERYRYLPGMEPLDVLHGWQELGALLQVNV